jgi:hypothetical protein
MQPVRRTIMAEHTPTPWHTDQVELFDTFNQVLGLIRTTANAAFIVRAVNCHEELMAALEEVAAEHVVLIDEMSVECLQQTLTWKMARAGTALAKVKEEAPA